MAMQEGRSEKNWLTLSKSNLVGEKSYGSTSANRKHTLRTINRVNLSHQVGTIAEQHVEE